MKKKEQYPLHELVHSLSASEKRYFKQNAGQNTRNGKSNYLVLFEAIANMPEWSQEELARQTSEIANLPATINQLNDLIFKVLGQISSRHNPIHQLRDLIAAIENASDKGLKAQYRKYVGRAVKLATEYDRYPALLELLGHRLELVYQGIALGNDSTDTLAEEEADLLKQIQIDSQYAQLYRTVQKHLMLKNLAGDQERSKWEAIRKDKLLNGGPKGKSLLSKITYHNIRGLIAYTFADNATYQAEYKKVLELWSANPHQIETHQDRYLGHLRTYLDSWLRIHDAEGFRKVLEEFRQVKLKSDSARLKMEEQFYVSEFTYHLNFSDYKAQIEYVTSLSNWMQKHAPQVKEARRQLLYYNMSIFYFLNEEYTFVREALHPIIQSRSTSERTDIRNFAPVFDLVTLYELREIDPKYYESLFDSRLRWLERKENKEPLEQEMYNFIRKAQPVFQKEEAKSIWQDAKAALEKIVAATPGDQAPLGCMELLFWLEARIEGKKVREVFRKRLDER